MSPLQLNTQIALSRPNLGIRCILAKFAISPLNTENWKFIVLRKTANKNTLSGKPIGSIQTRTAHFLYSVVGQSANNWIGVSSEIMTVTVHAIC